ncbi:MAG: hypothetical protein AB9873_13045 [Syntrophobacteraceae bacterium]
MANIGAIEEIMRKLVIADKHVIGEIMAGRGVWKAGTSAVNNSYKDLVKLVELGRLEKCDGFFRLVGCRSDYKEHAQLLTQYLANIIKSYQCVIYREHEVKPISLRSDAIVLLIKENKGRCLVVEVVNQETQQYLNQKREAWKWDGATEYLSGLFGYRIPYFEFLTSEETI